jgi:hypothetical protein
MLTTRETLALVFAASADALQVGLLPIFGEGVLSPIDDALDVGMFILMTKLLGWHPLLLPTIVAEMIPAIDLAPTWTLAALIIIWRKRQSSSKTIDVSVLPLTDESPARKIEQSVHEVNQEI